MDLYPHQKQVLSEIKNKNRCALYLDMGLGKTFVASEKMKELNDDLVVIVCPKSVVSTWETHIKRYYPQYQVFTYNLPEELLKKTVIIINYDLIWRRTEFLKLKDYTLILDESQFIKNSKATRTKFIMKLKFKADATDVLIFIIFAIFLFYIVCLGIINFPELAINGRFYGLNPLPALAPSRIITTIVFYLIFQITFT